ncbi:hypothetical protein GWR56_11205 [Mucilaginibacter sp. 14171R-50]|uniref:hypothetical protein n=1 Tax=Mucilaginibacter sp. 14171R-50 TaxID=2703789 RepID=UPI00138BA624|nr:hypothetical protein [Mucilaginibacter sp. 14171R-50]QHS56073.1 hypothetical protein GWR56_11205 [Mucilaginibacter sp. 14171R-50]
MKKYYFLVLPFFLSACTQKTNSKYTYTAMPKNELEFIKELNLIDSAFQRQNNEITKKEFLEKGKKDVSNYVLNHLKIDNWVAIVNEIEVGETDLAKYIKVELMVPNANWREDKYPEFNSLILVNTILDKDSKIKDQLRAIKKGDEVLISGNIVKSLSDGINVITHSPSGDEESTFSNLELSVDLTDIKGTH